MKITELKALCLAGILSLTLSATHAQTVVDSFLHDSIMRDYRLYLPPGYTPGESLPIVLNFHGYTSTAEAQEVYSEFNLVADTAHIMVCYPNGVGNQWNTGFGATTDDVGFVDQLIDTLYANYNIDLERVFATGMSNGGYMSHKLACELADRIAAIASVTGSMTPAENALCNPGGPIPVMQIHGTADLVVPYDGGTLAIPMDDLVDYWVSFNNCSDPPVTTDIPNIDPFDLCTAERIEYAGCDSPALVVFYKIDGGGHSWPGASINIAITNRDFYASQAIWEFFRKVTTPEVSVTGLGAPSGMEYSPQVSPNPFAEHLRIMGLPEDMLSVSLTNILGRQLVVRKSNSSTSLRLATSGLPPGMFFLKIQTGSGFSSCVVLKQ